MDYNSQASAYERFIIDEAYNQYKLGKYIEEAILWTSNNMTYEKLHSLNEGLKETIKEKLKAAWEKIKEIVRKVIGTIKNAAMSRQKFLEENKDVILKRQVKYKEEFDLYPYEIGIKRIGNTRIVEYDYGKVTGKSGGKMLDPEDFNATVVHGYFGIEEIESDKEDFKDKCKDYFRGANNTKTYTNKQINMSNMYDFCVNYKTKIEDVLNSDQKKIDNSFNKAMNNLTSVKIEDKEKNTNESYLFESEPVFSLFFDKYITEDGQNNQPDPPKQEEKETDGTENKSVRNAAEHIKNNRMDTSKEKQADTKEMETDVNNDQENWNKREAAIRCWAEAAQDLLAAKAEICKEIYDTYLKIIEKHVASYVGKAKDDTSDRTNQKNVTDYNNEDLKPEAKEALEKQKEITDVQIRYTGDTYEKTDGNAFALKITLKDEQGNTREVYQDVKKTYPEASDNNLSYKAESIRRYKDKNGLWKISRRYFDSNNGGTETKDRFLYIDPTKDVMDATTAGYDDGKTLDDNQNK